jgi:hypothetical protein
MSIALTALDVAVFSLSPVDGERGPVVSVNSWFMESLLCFANALAP